MNKFKKGAIILGLIIIVMIFFVFFYNNEYSGFQYIKPGIKEDTKYSYGFQSTKLIKAVDGSNIEAWYYTPKLRSDSVIIMTGGMAATKEDGLEKYALYFMESGYSVLLFDYRTFGGSEGMPRHWLDMGRQLDDFTSVVTFAKEILKFDSIALWGSSYSGGIALTTAANNIADIDCVISQVSFIRNPEEFETNPGLMLRFLPWLLIDSARLKINNTFSLNLEPIYVPAFGKPGENAFLVSSESPSIDYFENNKANPESVYWDNLPKEYRGGWENKILIRGLIGFEDQYLPVNNMEKIMCPVFLLTAENDMTVPAKYIREAYERIPHNNKRISTFDCGHFDIYIEDNYTRAVKEQIEFLNEYL